MKRNMSQSGITLIELVIGMAVMVIVLSGIGTLFTNLLGHGVTGSNAAVLQQDARWAVDMMAREIRYATNTPTVSGGNRLTFTINTNETVTYALGNVDGSAYSQTLYRRVLNGTARPITEQTSRGSVEALAFVVSGQTVEINLTLTKTVGAQTMSETAATTVTIPSKTRTISL